MGGKRVQAFARGWDSVPRLSRMAGDGVDFELLLGALVRLGEGDFSARLPAHWAGLPGKIADAFNRVVQHHDHLAKELHRLSRAVGVDGKLDQRAWPGEGRGSWGETINSVNALIDSLAFPTSQMARVIGAVAAGDLSQEMPLEIDGRPLRGQFRRLAGTVNMMVAQVRSFDSEVSRVAREVGTEGKLGGQARVPGLAGTWKELTENVNLMAGNLTAQVRGIAQVVTAVANGNLRKKLSVVSRGEIAALADTINGMTDTLATFADQVTTVAWEVGVEGKLGGQASVPGAAGTWRDLTDNVNQLAANLTTQVRAIAEVATAVTKGDLSQSIKVQARGEVAALKANINEMILNLKETTAKNTEQEWLQGNLARFSRMLQGQRDLPAVARRILSELAPVVSARHGLFYVLDTAGGEPSLRPLASYAGPSRPARVKLGEGLVGQCAVEKNKIILANVPRHYLKVRSGLGAAAPINLLVLPILFEGNLKGVLELASFERFSPAHLALLDPLLESIGIVVNTIEASMRTEDLLDQSRRQAEQLRQSEEGFRLLMEGVKDYAIYMLDEQGRVASWNVGAEQITGYRAEEIIGLHSSRFFPGEEVGPDRVERQLQLTAFEGRFEEEGWRVRKDGTRFWANAITTALRDDQGRLRGYAEVIRDITPRKVLEKAVLEISDREQRRIGHDLHDDLCQRLAGIEMMSQFLEQNLAARSLPEATTAAEITKLVRNATSHTRDLAHGLSPVTLEADGLVPALQELAASTEKLFKVSCTFRCEGSACPLDNAVATHLYRIAQEALTNAVKHGKARRARVRLARVHNRFLLTIKDDGVGFPKTPRDGKGMGLRIMRYRAGMIGGSLTIQADPDGGTNVTCSLRISDENPPTCLQP